MKKTHNLLNLAIWMQLPSKKLIRNKDESLTAKIKAGNRLETD